MKVNLRKDKGNITNQCLGCKIMIHLHLIIYVICIFSICIGTKTLENINFWQSMYIIALINLRLSAAQNWNDESDYLRPKKHFPSASAQPLHHQDSCRASSWLHMVTGDSPRLIDRGSRSCSGP